MAGIKFNKTVIGELMNNVRTAEMNVSCSVADMNGDGRPDFVVSGRNGEMAWFENSGTDEWPKHHITGVRSIECGCLTYDLTGNGFPDIINGSDYESDEMCWWENAGKFDGEWTRRVIAKTGKNQMHDTLVGEIKNDGVKYLVFTNQGDATTVYCVPLPENPYQSPWPGLEVIAEGKFLPNPRNPKNRTGTQADEGLALGDVDNDGELELVCGTNYYKWDGGKWECVRFTDKNYITTKIVVADIDRDGKNEIILAEGDAYIYGHDEGSKLAWFKPSGDDYKGIWKERIIDFGLLDAHSLAVADLCGNGFPDIFAGEIGVVRQDNGNDRNYIVRPPKLMVYENDGKGNFIARHTVDEGTGTHEAFLIDVSGDGKLGIIGKPCHGAEMWKVHLWTRV